MSLRSYFQIALFLFSSLHLMAQNKDSIQIKDLEPYTYHFEIKDGKLLGSGKEFIEKEAALHQYVLLGEYHGSYQISKFTEALIPILAKNDFNTFGLEVGPISGQILSELSKNEATTIQKLHQFNSQYYVDEDGDYYGAIPFFEHVEDAAFLKQAAQYNWNLIGLDQEFIYGYEPLFDRMYQQLTSKEQETNKALFKEVKDSLMYYYELEASGDKDLAVLMYTSPLMERFLTQITSLNADNQPIVGAVRATNEIYNYNATREYLKCNSTRIDYMKQNLRKGFEQINFDLEKDKMLLKMGGVHTARGFSWLSLFELGNTLNELANYHGNSTLHISFSNRFWEEEGEVSDALDSKRGYRYKDFLQMGKADQWTIIDLRPLKSSFFYARKYLTSDIIKEAFKQHDLIIIPPTDKYSTLNFDLRK